MSVNGNSIAGRLKEIVNWPPASKTNDLSVFILLNALLFWPAIIAGAAINVSQKPIVNPEASPLGYTISLVMFWFPCVALGWWALRKVRDSARTWAFGVTLCLLCPIGFGLDFLFGRLFLKFENKASVIASRWGEMFTWHAYKYDGGEIAGWIGGLFSAANWDRFIPIEEMLFYALGFLAMLLIYLWGDSVVFPRHKVDAFQKPPLLFSSFRSSAASYLALGAAVFGLAYWYQKEFAVGGPEKFPGYFLFLLLTAFLPSMFCFPISYHFVNWRSLTMAWLFVLCISQFWEGSLGVPYQWWGYEKAQMIGIYVRSQCDLPIEAVLLWSLASWTTVMVYEFLLAVMRLDEALSGLVVRSSRQKIEGKIRAACVLVRRTEKSIGILKRKYHLMGQSKQARAALNAEGVLA